MIIHPDPLDTPPQDNIEQEYTRQAITEYAVKDAAGQDKRYDTEWIKFMLDLSKNDSINDIVDFINANSWTTRQKIKVMSYARVMLGRNLATTFIVSARDHQMVFDDKALIDVDLALGMTTFDLTPEFNILLGMISLHFGIETRRSRLGFWTKRIGTHTTEILQAEQDRERRQASSWKDKIADRLGVGGG